MRGKGLLGLSVRKGSSYEPIPLGQALMLGLAVDGGRGMGNAAHDMCGSPEHVHSSMSELLAYVLGGAMIELPRS